MADQEIANVVVLNGRHKDNRYSLTQDSQKLIIGRDNKCDIQILDKGISRNHSRIEWKNGQFLLVDLGSTNGTFVNGKIIISRVLQSQDIIRIGQTELKYSLSEKSAQKTTVGKEISEVDELLERSPNTIIEKVDIGQSLYNISVQDLVKEQKQNRGESPGSSTANITQLFLSTIYEVGNMINAEQDQEKMLNTLMDKVMEVFQPDRGYLVIQEGEEFQISVSKGVSFSAEPKLSRTILDKTITKGLSVSSANAMLDDRFSGGMSIVTQNIKSVMSVPLESHNKVLGAIYVDSLGASNRFEKTHLDLLTAIGRQAGVALERANLFSHYLEKEKMEQALDIAKDIQKSFLPKGVPDNFEYDLVGWNLSCDATGGDYYDVLELPNQKWGLAIGDVTGHGVGSALLMATARAFLKALAWKSDNITKMIDELNMLLAEDMEDDKFMTMFYGEFDPSTMMIKYANAGHDNPLIYRKATKQFEELESTGIPLGMMEEFSYEEGEPVQVNSGDILILSTDGITESMNPEGEQFGNDRMEEIIRKGESKSANQIVKDCYDALQAFCRGTKQRDDLTLLVIKFDPRYPKGSQTSRHPQMTS